MKGEGRTSAHSNGESAMVEDAQSARSRRFSIIWLVVALILGVVVGHVSGSAIQGNQVAQLTTRVQAALSERDDYAARHTMAEAARVRAEEARLRAEAANQPLRAERDRLTVRVAGQERRHRCAIAVALRGTRIALGRYKTSLTATDARNIFRRFGSKAVGWIPVVGDAAGLGVDYYLKAEADRKLREMEEQIAGVFKARPDC